MPEPSRPISRQVIYARPVSRPLKDEIRGMPCFVFRNYSAKLRLLCSLLLRFELPSAIVRPEGRRLRRQASQVCEYRPHVNVYVLSLVIHCSASMRIYDAKSTPWLSRFIHALRPTFPSPAGRCGLVAHVVATTSSCLKVALPSHFFVVAHRGTPVVFVLEMKPAPGLDDEGIEGIKAPVSNPPSAASRSKMSQKQATRGRQRASWKQQTRT